MTSKQYIQKYWPIIVVVVVIVVGGYIATRHAKTNSTADQKNSAQNGSMQTALTQGHSTITMAPAKAAGKMMPPATGQIWQGTLEQSNNPAKGNLMLVTPDHTFYLRTSRDFSSLIGKKVNVSYSGSLTNFSLTNITPQ